MAQKPAPPAAEKPKSKSRANKTSFKPGHSSAGGRPIGVPNRRSQEFLEEAQERGVVPVRVMFEAIEHFQRRAQDAAKEGNPSEQDRFLLEAVGVAVAAAPFCHAKLRQIDIKADVNERREEFLLLGKLTDEELLMRLRMKRVGHQPLTLVQGGSE